MTIATVLEAKGVAVATVGAGSSVRDALGELASRRIGALPVIEAGRIVGIFSERDAIRAIHEGGAAILDGPVDAAMTREVITAHPRASVLSALALMTEKRIRHLPVVESDEIRGIVSIGDLVKHRIERIEAEADALRAYIRGD